MSDTDDALRTKLLAVREYLRTKQRDLELDATLIRGRTEEVREALGALDDLLDDAPRRGRPRKVIAINPQRQPGDSVVMPPRVPGSAREPETEESLV